MIAHINYNSHPDTDRMADHVADADAAMVEHGEALNAYNDNDRPAIMIDHVVRLEAALKQADAMRDAYAAWCGAHRHVEAVARKFNARESFVSADTYRRLNAELRRAADYANYAFEEYTKSCIAAGRDTID